MGNNSGRASAASAGWSPPPGSSSMASNLGLATSTAAPLPSYVALTARSRDHEQPERIGLLAEEEEEVSSSEVSKAEHDRVFSKLNWRVLPLFFVMVIVNYIDRNNLAFASIQLNQDLGFSSQVYGTGSGLFFLTYASLQVPSNLILRRVGGPTWLSLIIAVWGVCAMSFSAMRTKGQFYLLRTLLGLAEAGAFPGMWYMLARFYPNQHITHAYAVVEVGVALSHVVAGPLAAAFLSLNGLHGMRGWQWLFICEGLPSLVLAFFMYNLLPASPATAAFLEPHEQKFLVQQMSSSAAATNGTPGSKHSSHGGADKAHGGGAGDVKTALWAAASNPYVLYLAVSKILKDMAGFSVIFFTPLIVQSLVNGQALDLSAKGGGDKTGGHGSPHDVGVQAALLTSVPFAMSAAVAFWIAHNSQRVGERLVHFGLPFLLCGLVLLGFPLVAKSSGLAAFLCLTVGIIGVYSGTAPGLALLSELAAGPGLVVALPLYNSVGNIGGFIGPWLTGIMVDRTHSYAYPALMMGACLAGAGAMVLLMPKVLRMPPTLVSPASHGKL